MDLPAGESKLAQEMFCLHGQRAGLRPSWLAVAGLWASRCWHGTDSGTDKPRDRQGEHITCGVIKAVKEQDSQAITTLTAALKTKINDER